MEKPIVFKNKRGKQLIGILHLPETKGKFPLVIICHGFGGTKSKIKFVDLSRTLLKKGIASFRFDFEGCGDSEGSMKNITLKNQVSDLKIVMKNICRIKGIDKKRIAILGNSLGSAVVAYFTKENTSYFKILVFWAPALNQKDIISKMFSKKEIEIIKKDRYIAIKEKIIGIKYFNENKDKDYSELFSKFNSPVFIAHGTKDEKVSIEFSKKLAKKFSNIKFKEYKRACHKFEDYLSRQELIKDTSNMFIKYLK